MGAILLVEQDAETAERWVAALGAEGHEVLSVQTTCEAPAVLREGGIDVVLLDCYDTCAGVLELARMIEALPDAPPIVLISGSPAAPEISVRIGAAVFVPKPCEPSEVVAAAARQLGRLRPVRSFDDEPTGRNQQIG